MNTEQKKMLIEIEKQVDRSGFWIGRDTHIDTEKTINKLFFHIKNESGTPTRPLFKTKKRNKWIQNIKQTRIRLTER